MFWVVQVTEIDVQANAQLLSALPNTLYVLTFAKKRNRTTLTSAYRVRHSGKFTMKWHYNTIKRQQSKAPGEPFTLHVGFATNQELCKKTKQVSPMFSFFIIKGYLFCKIIQSSNSVSQRQSSVVHSTQTAGNYDLPSIVWIVRYLGNNWPIYNFSVFTKNNKHLLPSYILKAKLMSKHSGGLRAQYVAYNGDVWEGGITHHRTHSLSSWNGNIL